MSIEEENKKLKAEIAHRDKWDNRQCIILTLFLVFALGMGVSDRIYQSFIPEFSLDNFMSLWVSLGIVVWVGFLYPKLWRYTK